MKYAHLSIFLLIISAIILTGCVPIKDSQIDISTKSTDELVRLLEDPNDPNHLFGAITAEFARRGPSASDASRALSMALTYPRRDSYLAGFALIAIGPDAKSAIPILVSELTNKRVSVQRYAALSLGAIGKSAECAVPYLAKLLWDSNAETRSSSSISLDAITGLDLVELDFKLDPKTPGVMPIDDPDGVISNRARIWWQNEGKNLDWHPDACLDPK